MHTEKAVKLIDKTLFVLIYLLWIMLAMVLLSQMFHDEAMRLINGKQDDGVINQTEFLYTNKE